MFKKTSKIILSILLAVFMVCSALPAYAKVSKEEAERLKKDLTPNGAERARNADGTIPAWDGGITKIPDHVNYDPKKLHPDPFADDKVLFTITAQNMDQYADKLTPGLQQMFKKYPDTYKMDIYPTRRSFGAPQFHYDRTYDCALKCEVVDEYGSITGFYGGAPFPIPKNGFEVMLNHNNRWTSKGYTAYSASYLVHANGSRSGSGTGIYTYNYKEYTRPESEYDVAGYCGGVMIQYYEPARRKGEVILVQSRDDHRGGPRGAWQYLPGSRRVRRAPSIDYDTPNATFGGYATYDDAYMYNGKMDRFDWKLLGKTEMFIPYNNHQFALSNMDDLLTPYHYNPKYVRWELHRVWVVESPLRDGKRHCYGKRMFWVDEDCWLAALSDKYDTRGTLWRTALGLSSQHYTIPAYRLDSWGFYDFQVDTYVAGLLPQGLPLPKEEILPDDFFTIQSVRKLGKR